MDAFNLPNGPFSDVTLHMGRGDDALVGAGNGSAIYGNGGEDLVMVSGGELTLSGGEDDDTITTSSSGGSVVVGGSGNDAIEFNRGTAASAGDTIFGGVAGMMASMPRPRSMVARSPLW